MAGIDVLRAITGKQARLLANALIAAVGPARAGVAVGAPGGAERHLHPAAHLAVLGHAFRNVLQRLDGQRAAGLYIDAVGRRGGTAQGGVTLGIASPIAEKKGAIARTLDNSLPAEIDHRAEPIEGATPRHIGTTTSLCPKNY